MPSRLRSCPVCGTPAPRRIVYGMPTADLLEDPDVAIGGCLVPVDPPRRRCRNPDCGHEFGGRSAQ